MSNETSKLTIAIEYLNTAATLWVHELNYFSALHLAAAAEEISGKQCRINGTTSYSDDLKETVRRTLTRLGIAYEKQELNALHESKNAVKHMDSRNDSHVSFDARDEASHYIRMALRNFQKLDLESLLSEAVKRVVDETTIFIDLDNDEISVPPQS